jgi:hypothetical protein
MNKEARRRATPSPLRQKSVGNTDSREFSTGDE